MEETPEEIVNPSGQAGQASLKAWMERFIQMYGRKAREDNELLDFVISQLSSGTIARHDPERMARAQEAGVILQVIVARGWDHLYFDHRQYIVKLLEAVRDGKA